MAYSAGKSVTRVRAEDTNRRLCQIQNPDHAVEQHDTNPEERVSAPRDQSCNGGLKHL